LRTPCADASHLARVAARTSAIHDPVTKKLRIAAPSSFRCDLCLRFCQTCSFLGGNAEFSVIPYDREYAPPAVCEYPKRVSVAAWSEQGIEDMGIAGIIGLCLRGFIAAAFAVIIAAGPAAAQIALKFTLESKFEGPSALFLTGIDRGYYKAENLVVTVDAGADAMESITRVSTGAYDMGIVDINTLIKYRDQNPASQVKAVYMVYNKPAYAVVGRKSRGVNAPKDLEGKKLGAPAADSAFAQWKLFTQVNRIDASKISIENIGFPVREPLLQNGQVDAVVGHSYTILPNLKFMGVPTNDITSLLMADYGLSLYGSAIIVNPKFAAEKPEAVRAFLQAFTRSVKETVRNPVLALDSVLKRNDTLTKEVELERLRMILRENVLTPEVKTVGYGGIDFTRLAQAIDQLVSVNEFKAKPKAADIFDGSFLPTASARKTH
jgi:NitT/TauT family transport system substrate-binding protein